MGTMPFHLEKGIMGLRFDYLTRSPAVRQYFLSQLGLPGADPFVVGSTIGITIPPAPTLTINVFDDIFTDFKTKLDTLANMDRTPADPDEPRSGSDYDLMERGLDLRNRDTTGNRARFVGYWRNYAPGLNPNLRAEIVQALTAALNAGRDRIDYWWDCSLRDTDAPTVICSLDSPRVARVLFLTPHPEAVESHIRNKLLARRPIDNPNVPLEGQESPPVA